MGTRWLPGWSVLAVALLVASGCSTSSGQKGDGDLTDEKRRTPAFYESIPADTSYVATGLERYPSGDKEGARQAQYDMTNRILKSVPEEFRVSGDPVGDFLKAYAKAMGNELDAEALEANGIRSDGYFAIHGYHLLPVYRWELADGEAFEEFIGRVEKNAEVEPEMKTRNGVQYRLYGNTEWKLVLTIRDGWLVGSMVHEELLDDVVPYLLGQDQPDESLADTRRMQRLQKRYDFLEWSVGYADISKIVRIGIGAAEPDETTAKLLELTGAADEVESEVCRREMASAIDRVPRAVMGFDKYNQESLRIRFGVEIDEDLASPMHEATTGVPAAQTSLFDGAALGLGFGVDLSAMHQFLKEEATAVVEAPYECEELQAWNDWAKRVNRQSVPPVVSDLQGASLVLDDFTFPSGGRMPSSIRALALVRSANPEEIVGRLQMRVPGLGSANLKRDGTPVSLDQLGGAAPFIEAPHAAMTESAFGMSLGSGMADVLADRISEPAAGAEGEAAVLRYDLNKLYASLPRQYRRQIDGFLGTSLSGQSVSGRFGLEFREEGVFGSMTVDYASDTDDGSESASGDD